MSKQMKIGLAVAAIVAAAIVFGMVTYIEHVKDDAETKAKIEIQQAVIDSAKNRIEDIEKDLKARNDVLEKLKDIKTPQQAQKVIHEYTPLPTAEVLPDSPSSAKQSTLTFEDAKKLADFGVTCKQCENARDAALATITEKDIEIEAANQQRDAAIANARGGGFFKRLKRNTKWLVIGIGVGAAATAMSHR